MSSYSPEGGSRPGIHKPRLNLDSSRASGRLGLFVDPLGHHAYYQLDECVELILAKILAADQPLQYRIFSGIGTAGAMAIHGK